jgi:hypothetical protein
MVHVELNNIYINIGANKGRENYEQKTNIATSRTLIKAVYASYVYVHKVLNFRPAIKPRLTVMSLFHLNLPHESQTLNFLTYLK